MKKTIRVALAEDAPAMRDAVAALLRDEDGFELVGAVGTADDAVALVERESPDVALIDVRMPGSGPAATRRIVTRSPHTRVVALSAHDNRASVLQMLEAGAVGYVVKGAPVPALLEAIRGAAKGEGCLSASVTGVVIGELADHLSSVHDREAVNEACRARVLAAMADAGGLEMAFQPICRLDDRTEFAVEALARFAGEPYRSPDCWFAEAAEVGLRAKLEIVAIERSLVALAALPATAALSINISPDTVLGGGLDAVLTGIDLTRVILELTEHAAVHDYDALTDALAGYRQDGLRVAVDDAGSGFASLRHILKLAPDVIKLDRSLTAGIEDNRSEQALAVGLISFARQFGAFVIAEGIEREEQLAVLLRLGVDGGQGYLLGRPGPLPIPAQASH